MPNFISKPTTHHDLLASSPGRVLIQQASAPGAISCVSNIVASAARSMLPSHQNAGTRPLALAAAGAATATVLRRVADIIRSRKMVSDDNVDAISDAADALEVAGDYSAAAKNLIAAEAWYGLARKLNRGGFRATAMCQHEGRQSALSAGF
jgi:hypothetical protein